MIDYEEISAVFVSQMNLKDSIRIQPKLADLIENRFKNTDIKGFFQAETHIHTYRVSKIAEEIAIQLNLSENDIYLIKAIAPLHDFGKLAVDTQILNKPSKLTHEEFKEIQNHSIKGFETLQELKSDSLLDLASLIALEHHEKWEGGGYPFNKRGEDIHLFSRIIAAADILDSLSAKRCYKKAWDKDRIYNLVKEERGKHFDPVVGKIVEDNLSELLAA